MLELQSSRARVWRLVVLAPSGLVMIALLGTGLLKAVDVPEFASVVGAWKIIPASLVWPISFGVVVAEISISLAWFINLKRALASVAAFLILAFFTIAYLVESYLAEPPDCGCLGAWADFRIAEHAVVTQVTRNGLLMALLGTSMMLPLISRAFARRKDTSVACEEKIPPPPTARGATITEILMVIAVMSVLLLLISGPLGKARSMSNDVVSKANLRTHMANVTMYAGDWADMFPMFMDTKSPQTILRHNGRTMNVVYFLQTEFWSIMMAKQYYENLWPHPSQVRSDATDRWNSYLLSSTIMTSPAFGI